MSETQKPIGLIERGFNKLPELAEHKWNPRGRLDKDEKKIIERAKVNFRDFLEMLNTGNVNGGDSRLKSKLISVMSDRLGTMINLSFKAFRQGDVTKGEVSNYLDQLNNDSDLWPEIQKLDLYHFQKVVW